MRFILWIFFLIPSLGLAATAENSSGVSLCGTTLPPQMRKYVRQTEAKFGTIECVRGNMGPMAKLVGTKALIFYRQQDIGNVVTIAHELMHLWMCRTGKWKLDDMVLPNPPVPNSDIASEIQMATYALLMDNIQHRVFMPILNASGISEHANYLAGAEEFIDFHKKDPAHDEYAGWVGAYLYEKYVGDPESARYLDEHTTAKNWDLALKTFDY
jgi:hypothetical protein